jgi:hypothetical protein
MIEYGHIMWHRQFNAMYCMYTLTPRVEVNVARSGCLDHRLGSELPSQRRLECRRKYLVTVSLVRQASHLAEGADIARRILNGRHHCLFVVLERRNHQPLDLRSLVPGKQSGMVSTAVARELQAGAQRCITVHAKRSPFAHLDVLFEQ